MRKTIKQAFKGPEERFLIGCGLKISGLYLATLLVYAYVMWVIISINAIYFESKLAGFTQETRGDFVENAILVVTDEFVHIFWFLPFLFFCGIYIGKVLIRPFYLIGNYCKQKVEESNAVYKVDRFTDYKLLSDFSKLFFKFIDDAEEEGLLKAVDYPGRFKAIHGPKFEKVFFFNFLILILFLSTLSGVFFYFISGEIHSGLLDLSLQFLKDNDQALGYFVEEQKALFFSVVLFFIFHIFLSYLILSFHFYGRISGAIFAFFSTMRSFMRGRFSSRVHLIGYTQVRIYGRWFNKYLDNIEKKINKNKTKGKL